MIQRYKGVIALKDDWDNSNKIIPDEFWAVVIFEGTVSNPVSIGLKLGVGKSYQNTVFLFDPRWLELKISKPLTDTPDPLKFLSEDGQYYTINQGSGSGLTLNEFLSYIDSEGYALTSIDQVNWIVDQMYENPVIDSFSSSSSFIGAVAMNTVISGNLSFSWSITNGENLSEITLTASEGNWTGSGLVVNPQSANNKTLTLVGSISSSLLKTITFTLNAKNSKNESLSPRTLKISYTYKIYWGTADTRNISSLNSFTSVSSIQTNNINQRLTFTPTGNQYSVILIPNELNVAAINIVNVNAGNSDHSYMMNEGSGPTAPRGSVIIQGVLYQIYVSYNRSFGLSTAEIKT